MNFRESQGNVAGMFMVKRKKFFTSITGRTYDPGKKLTKAEKKEKEMKELEMKKLAKLKGCLLYTSPSPRDATLARMPSSA